MSASPSISGAQTDDEEDGYAPLFDYTDIQPSILTDDDNSDEEDVQIFQKPQVFKPYGTKRGREVIKESMPNANANNANETEEDWLPPPPKSTKVVPISAVDDSMLGELRSRKEQLISLTTESTEDILRKLEESAKLELQKAANSHLHGVGSEALESSTIRKKIVVSIQDKKGSKPFRIYVDDKLEKLFKAYAEYVKGRVDDLVFCFDGGKISPSQTAQGLEMEDEDIIEVYSRVG
ncbi:hypothetical protein SUGI_0113850 [Cryptomeria japonica]|uniref:uncharacterized protein LOC131054263 n=1 Tax=Cryptomeria japonica TaxID=3369 RepID=UPI002408D2F4|nr:uncharacterized protein LOC131054263 [Cryptomeria japonica]GLJ09669.1 hypothetical protein SUGI_0113850 [Cryptomeria japonica]